MKRTFLAAALLLAACTPPPVQTAAAPACAAPLKPALQVDLYFGEVGQADWAAFLDEEVTPRFPDGLSVIDVAGQYRESSGRMVREKTKLIVVVVFDATQYLPRVQAVIDAYKRRHAQNSVFRTEHPVCAGGCTVAAHNELGDMHAPNCHKPSFEAGVVALARDAARELAVA